jgi:UPF0755 protein
MKKARNKKFRLLFLSLFALTLVLVLRLSTLTRPPSSQEQFQSIVIQKSSSASEVSQLLKDKQLIRSPLIFKLYLRFTNQQSQIQAGSHRLSPHLSLKEISQIITSPPEGTWITFPEGWRREQYAEELNQTFVSTRHSEPDEIGSKNLLRSQDQNSSFQTQTFLDQTRELEGQLFPDTYLFPTNASTELVIKTLSDTFDQKASETLSNLNNNLTADQTLILASILERETITNEEKPIVAGILIKRLENDWPLQADATIQYAIATPNPTTSSLSVVEGRDQIHWWKTNLTTQDLEVASPYNTYTNPGLPPSPICNPGIESIKAAANPQTSPYWFYLHDPNGQLHYAKTIEDHNANVSNYLK